MVGLQYDGDDGSMLEMMRLIWLRKYDEMTPDYSFGPNLILKNIASSTESSSILKKKKKHFLFDCTLSKSLE